MTLQVVGNSMNNWIPSYTLLKNGMRSGKYRQPLGFNVLFEEKLRYSYNKTKLLPIRPVITDLIFDFVTCNRFFREVLENSFG